MATNNSKGLAVGLERAKVGFAAWRETRRGAERIPGGLWDEAVRAARQHGVHRVSRELGLDYNHLKRRCGGVARGQAARASAPAKVFVELEGPGSAEGLACLVELEKGNGTRMRICVRDTVAVDWGKLKEAFLGA
jgi:hypothetical protein